MALFASLVVLGMASSSVMGGVPFSVRDCANNRATKLLTFTNVRVHPYPVAIPGDLHVTGALTLNRNVTGDLSLDVTIERYLGFFWLTVPCISQLGSCTYKDACGMLETTYGARSGVACPPEVTATGLPCTCPIPAGTYSMTNAVFSIPELTGFRSRLAEGDYRITAKLVDTPTGEEVACQHLEVTIVDGHPKCSGFLCSIIG